MAKARKKKTSGGRGSAEAIEKRRAARAFNALLTSDAKKDRLDGRTEKRRQRLIKELKEGKRGNKELKPVDFLQHVEDLLSIGESVSSLKKQGVKVRKLESTPEVMDSVERMQAAYDFRPETWKMFGITVTDEGGAKPAKRATRKKSTRKKSSRKKTSKK